ncbi:hypothetical protein [Streptomyces sp. NBC_01207]|uniref:hypothetical protein n=1 Tax=Streptomyces sp. NBC_01207 TaxID=2903772 RepID=UPI002E1095B1|nr:hypothetical protein OG457_27280 [Streptomyces sp. NBC_01207]
MDNTAQTWQARADRLLTVAYRHGVRLEDEGDHAAPVVSALAELATACMQRARIAAAAECPTCEGVGVVNGAFCSNAVAHQPL